MAELTKEYFDQQLDERFDKQAQIIARGFEQTATKAEVKILASRLDKVEERIKKLEDKIDALSAKLTAHLELSDKRYLELKRRDIVIAKWIKQIADKTGVSIDLNELEKF